MHAVVQFGSPSILQIGQAWEDFEAGLKIAAPRGAVASSGQEFRDFEKAGRMARNSEATSALLEDSLVTHTITMGFQQSKQGIQKELWMWEVELK